MNGLLRLGERLTAAGTHQFMLQAGRGFGPQIIQKSRKSGLQGAAAHEGTEPVGDGWCLRANPRPPGQAQSVGATAHGPEQGIHEPGTVTQPLCP